MHKYCSLLNNEAVCTLFESLRHNSTRAARLIPGIHVTTLYKGIAIDPALAGLIRHMHDVEEYREVLANLQSGWDTLALLGELST